MIAPARFRFLNDERDVPAAGDWNAPEHPRLWGYNLHYFDDLNAAGAASRNDWHRALIARWVAENPPGKGIGWEPYPLSLRIVNWVKWSLAGNRLDRAMQDSLAVQARFLSRSLEYHLLGNHLFSNAKALLFAGSFFEGEEAASWLATGLRILEREIPEQILPDGGHFERSTMYHALALEDMLDLVNLAQAVPESFVHGAAQVSRWPEIAARMLVWLRAMCHPDGDIAFFNDAALGVAPSVAELISYGSRLGLAAPTEYADGIFQFPDSGYVRVQRGPWALIADLAPVGPDYLPAHAHADTLSFELSFRGQRVIVNSGTSQYGTGAQRDFERSTAAHSTLEIDGANSSEVWAGFRVARRAYPFGIEIADEGDFLRVSGAHTGYTRLPGKPVHRRTWMIDNGSLEVEDRMTGEFSRAVARFFVHPAVSVEQAGQGGIVKVGGEALPWQVEGASVRLLPSSYFPEFGRSMAGSCIEVSGTGSRIRFLLGARQ